MSAGGTVGRSSVQVRRVDPSGPDLDALACLWTMSRQPARGSGALLEDTRSIFKSALAGDEVYALLASAEPTAAEPGDQPRDIGYLVMTACPLSLLTGEATVSIEHLFVLPQARRLGVARALIAKATTYAEQLGAGQISSSVPVLGREEQRFFARLGFTPSVVRRVTSVSALRRRLTPQGDPRVEATVVRRRSLRARSRALALRAHAAP